MYLPLIDLSIGIIENPYVRFCQSNIKILRNTAGGITAEFTN